MSATGRIKVLSEPLQPPVGMSYPEGSTLRVVERTKRAKGDFYETPAWCIDAIIPQLPAGAVFAVDAGSGNGAIAARLAAKYPELEIVGVEKSEELVSAARARGLHNAEFVQANFEDWYSELGAPDMIVMNPPYSRAIEFVTRALATVKRGGTVAVLLRLNWLASKSRREFHRKHPSDIYVLTKRPSFTGRGTDATDYAWFVFGPDRGNRWFPLNFEERKKVTRGARKRMGPAAATE